VLSGVQVDEFAACVQAGDVTALTRIPGIGKKTAERMSSSCATASDLGGSGRARRSPARRRPIRSGEASVALQALGYKPPRAAGACSRTQEQEARPARR
jgi:holliday junction DNA helicase RuvA